MDRANSLVYGYTASQWYYDGVQRLSWWGHDLTGSSADVGTTLGRNPAGQIVSVVRGNDVFARGGHNAHKPA
jgi:hypothetical protein